MTDLEYTPLHALHVALGGKMVPFAGYSLPVQFPTGVMKEHLQCRAAAGLFDVSHMGQVRLNGADAAAALERIMPMDVAGLPAGRQRYGFFTTADGGILDDVMVSNQGGSLMLVVNAACKHSDIAHMRAQLGGAVEVEEITDRALLALQGPKAEAVLAALNPEIAGMRFMDVRRLDLQGAECWVSRSGYTGEDGFEISVPEDAATALAEALLDFDDVAPIGLGARDSLRLEAGLCLYGHDISTDTTPVEAGLSWAIGKARRAGGARAQGYPGADVIAAQLAQGPRRLRVGLLPQGRAPMREGAPLFARAIGGAQIGAITSGGFGPSLGAPVAMGYVPADFAAPGTTLYGELRGKRLPLTVTPMPFTPAQFER